MLCRHFTKRFYVIFLRNNLLYCDFQERVQTKERQSGAILAADELFNLLIRRPNWSEDLKKALRKPNVAHPDLADEIDRFERKALTFDPQHEINVCITQSEAIFSN